MNPSVTAVVLNYNRPHETIACVASLQACRYDLLKIVVVDNGSPDGSEHILRESLGSLDVLQTGDNIGFAAGTNAGIRHALNEDPEFVLIINNDTVVEPGFLGELVRALGNDQQAAAATGIICYHPDTQKIWYAGGTFVPWRLGGFTNGVGSVYGTPESMKPRDVTFVSGCLMLVRSNILRSVGVFDERFFMYHEDAELSIRIVSAGFRLLYVPLARIYHKARHLGDRPFQMYYSVRNRLLLGDLALSGWRKIIGKCYVVVVFSVKILIWALSKPELAAAAIQGFTDYRRKIFFRGNGFDLQRPRP